MAMKACVVVVAVVISCALFADDAVARRFRRSVNLEFTQDPQIVINNVTEELTIDCRPPTSLSDVQEFFTIFIEENGSPIASQGKNSDTEKMKEDARISVEGNYKVSTDDAPYLTVTITEPTFEDEGIYVCTFMYLDTTFKYHKHEAELNVTVQEAPEPDILPPTNSCDCYEIWSKLETLEEKILTENKLLKDQVKKYDETCRTSFSVKMKSEKRSRLENDKQLIFDGIISNQGGAYDNKTGAFTAPCTGQYFFTLTLRTVQEMDSGIVVGSIVTDGFVAARTSAFIDVPLNNYQTASNGVVMSLKEGQKVSVVLETNSAGQLVGEAYSVFSGFHLFP